MTERGQKIEAGHKAAWRLAHDDEHLAASGVTPTGGTPQELSVMIGREAAKWKKVIEVSGATAE